MSVLACAVLGAFCGVMAATLLVVGLLKAAQDQKWTRLEWELERTECAACEEDLFVARMDRYHARQAERIGREAESWLEGAGR